MSFSPLTTAVEGSSGVEGVLGWMMPSNNMAVVKIKNIKLGKF
jgi:hypothetical protein